MGAAILTGGDHLLIRTAERIASTLHERWDGLGYPAQLRGEEIPIEGRITTVADFYDALVHKRVHRPAFAPSEALKLIVAGSGTQFDPRVADAILELKAVTVSA